MPLAFSAARNASSAEVAYAGVVITPRRPASGSRPATTSDRGRARLRIWVLVICDTPVEQKCRCLLEAGLGRMLACRGGTGCRITDNAVRATPGFAPASTARHLRALLDAAPVI